MTSITVHEPRNCDMVQIR